MKRNDDEATNLENLKIHRHRNASIMYAGSRLDDLDKKPSLASIVRRWYVLQSKREKQRNANSFVWEQSGFDHRLGMFSSRAHGRLESFHLKMQHLAVSREEVFFFGNRRKFLGIRNRVYLRWWIFSRLAFACYYARRFANIDSIKYLTLFEAPKDSICTSPMSALKVATCWCS